MGVLPLKSSFYSHLQTYRELASAKDLSGYFENASDSRRLSMKQLGVILDKWLVPGSDLIDYLQKNVFEERCPLPIFMESTKPFETFDLLLLLFYGAIRGEHKTQILKDLQVILDTASVGKYLGLPSRLSEKNISDWLIENIYIEEDNLFVSPFEHRKTKNKSSIFFVANEASRMIKEIISLHRVSKVKFDLNLREYQNHYESISSNLKSFFLDDISKSTLGQKDYWKLEQFLKPSHLLWGSLSLYNDTGCYRPPFLKDIVSRSRFLRAVLEKEGDFDRAIIDLSDMKQYTRTNWIYVLSTTYFFIKSVGGKTAENISQYEKSVSGLISRKERINKEDDEIETFRQDKDKYASISESLEKICRSHEIPPKILDGYFRAWIKSKE